jgi:hypothetical protein
MKGLHNPGRPFQSARVLRQSRWIPPFLFFYCCLLRNRMPSHVPVYTKTKRKKKNRTEQINERKNERNILNITILLLINIFYM